ncbi:hypothetical protein KCTC32516_01260 [Polaribacter huanghezhanensis]|uniref:DUF423 domain-containing protein n=1 Tax=Polaribacter huanghezhanensis TaxID=1354726 RepID=UPI0026473B65|nr:DUF423 domain-containing protein [Polaribacter huanghezhanensis]WKD85911.1 hypothetical protein KCTC32516_01260 [Polaribacter huanghezhanensis]
MNKNLTITSVLGILTIILGAFGAHALSKTLTIGGLNSFETAVRYQMYHVIVLLFVNTYQGFTAKQKTRISWLFFLGILFFSGSIYVIELIGVSAKSIWFITPLGGLFLMLGWSFMAFSFAKRNEQ